MIHNAGILYVSRIRRTMMAAVRATYVSFGFSVQISPKLDISNSVQRVVVVGIYLGVLSVWVRHDIAPGAVSLVHWHGGDGFT